MLKRLEHAWRVLATGLAFLIFGVGGLLLRIVYFPLARLCFWRTEQQTHRAARRLIHYLFRGFIALLHSLRVLDYDIRGEEKLQRQGLLILANHPTLIDVVFLIALVPNADCVVKASLGRNLFTRGPVKATGYICNDSGAGLVQDCMASLQQGNSLIIFPEGTRTPLHGAMRLQRGAANIAIRDQRDITPVRIRCEPISLTKGQPWWQVADKRMHFSLEVCDDIQVQAFIAEASSEALAARQLTDYLHHYFSGELLTHARA